MIHSFLMAAVLSLTMFVGSALATYNTPTVPYGAAPDASYTGYITTRVRVDGSSTPAFVIPGPLVVTGVRFGTGGVTSDSIQLLDVPSSTGAINITTGESIRTLGANAAWANMIASTYSTNVTTVYNISHVVTTGTSVTNGTVVPLSQAAGSGPIFFPTGLTARSLAAHTYIWFEFTYRLLNGNQNQVFEGALDLSGSRVPFEFL